MAQSTAISGNVAAGGLTDALRRARSAEAAHFEAVLALSDAKALRLQVLKDDLDAVVAASPEARQAFDLALVAGDNPRLWIDLITSVIMEPDPRTYRLVLDGHNGRETLFETADRAEMVEKIKVHMAHGIIARWRKAAVPVIEGAGAVGYSADSLILAWLAGLSLGALALLGYLIYLNILHF